MDSSLRCGGCHRVAIQLYAVPRSSRSTVNLCRDCRDRLCCEATVRSGGRCTKYRVIGKFCMAHREHEAHVSSAAKRLSSNIPQTTTKQRDKGPQ